MTRNLLETVHQLLETPSWAPWLAFTLDELRSYAEVDPQGQIIHLGEDGQPAASLTSLRTEWSGDPATLRTWDEISGLETGIGAVHRSEGNTIVILSSSSRPDQTATGRGTALLRHIQRIAAEVEVEHLIGPFRPSGFGAFKATGGSVDFASYCGLQRADGQPHDPWLRAVSRLEMRPLRVGSASMVVEADLTELEALMVEYRPDAWFQLDAERAAVAVAVAGHPAAAEGCEVWECGETGSWFVDHVVRRATYVEANLWGELPIVAHPEGPSARQHVHVTPVPLSALEGSLVEEVVERAGRAEVALAWVGSTDPRAAVVRHLEAGIFPEITGFLSDEVETWCRFLVVVDLTQDPPQIGQAFRVSSHRYGDQGSAAIGMPTVDEIVTANDDLTLDGIVDHYRAEGIDLRRNIAVETSFRLPGLRSGARGLRWSDFGYVELFREAKRGTDDEDEERGVFAHVNEATVRSLRGIGISVARFAGRDDLRSPASQPGTHDDRYYPAYITARHRNGELFAALEEIAADAFALDPGTVEVVIDLRDDVVGSPVAEDVSSDGAREQPVQK